MTIARACIVVGLLSVALLAFGCGGEDASQAPPQAEVEQPSERLEQALGEAADEAAEQQEPSETAGSVGRSAGVEGGQRESEAERPSSTAAQSEDDAEPDHSSPEAPSSTVEGAIDLRAGVPAAAHVSDCISDDIVAEAERVAARDQSGQAEKAEASESTELDDDEWDQRLELIDAASEAMDGWFADLETLTLEAAWGALWDGTCLRLASRVGIQVNPLASWSVGDFSYRFEQIAGLPLGDTEQPVLMQQLHTRDGAYSTVTGLGGWTGPLWYWPLDYDSMIHQFFGIRPSLLGPLERDQVELDCAAYDGGAIVEDRFEGEAVWVVTCPTSPDSMMPFSGGYLEDELVLTVAEVTISQASGAPLLTEHRRAHRNRDGVLNWVSIRIALTGWDEPIAFPTPKPHVDVSQYAELIERLRTDAATPERLLLLLERRLATQHDMPWGSEISLRVDGGNAAEEPWVRVTRTPYALNRTVSFAEKVNGGYVWNTRNRLHWNDDGFWISEREVDGEPVWTRSTPAAHGFGDTSLDEVLAERALIDLDLFRELLHHAEIEGRSPSVEHADVSGRTYYEVRVESDVLGPRDPLFGRIAALLEAALHESGYDDVAVLRVETFDLGIWLPIRDLEELRLSGGGAFQTARGSIDLRISVGFKLSPFFLTDSGPGRN